MLGERSFSNGKKKLTLNRGVSAFLKHIVFFFAVRFIVFFVVVNCLIKGASKLLIFSHFWLWYCYACFFS